MYVRMYMHIVYRSTTKGGVVKRSDCIILVYGSTTKGDVVKSSDCILVYGSTTKGDVVRDVNTYVCTYVQTHNTNAYIHTFNPGHHIQCTYVCHLYGSLRNNADSVME